MGWNAVFILTFIVVLGVLVYKLTKRGEVDKAAKKIKDSVKEVKDKVAGK